MINPDQSNELFSKAVAFVNQTSQHLFITGKAGTGKTTFLKYIKANTYKKMAVVAPTGVAAINAGGVTIHSFFQLPFGAFLPGVKHAWSDSNSGVNNPSSLLKNLKMGAEKLNIIRELELLVIDEVSMVRADMLDAIDTVLRHVRKNNTPFGGVQMVYIGDLYQLPPVIKRNEWELLKDYYNSELFFSALSIQQAPPIFIELKKIYRQSDDNFIRLLNNIRNNCCTEDDLEFLHQYYKPGYIPYKEDNYIVLTTHNQKADAINQAELYKLPGREYVFEATITGEFYENSYPAEKTLKLKEGAQIMFIKNDKGESRKYFNGKIGTIKSLDGGKIIISFPGDESDLELREETWQNIRYRYDQDNDSIDEEEQGTFRQLPIRLAWAITIHKSQGLTFEKAIIDAGSSFAPGQVYVSLSRLTGLQGMVLFSRITPASITTDPRVQEFSKHEIFEDELQRVLEIEQQVFIQQSLVNIFDWNKLAIATTEHLESYQHRQLSDIGNAFEWASHLNHLVKEQKAVAEKFSRQLLTLLSESETKGTSELTERIKAAVEYFIKEIDNKLLPWMKIQIATTRAEKKNKRYLRALLDLQTIIEQKKQKLLQAVSMADALNKGSETEQLLNIVQQKTTSPKPESHSVKQKKSKPVKGDSGRLSLTMFREGKSITDIATERTLSPTTIYSHLIDFIRTGELDIYNLMDDEKVERILHARDTATEPGLGAIKTLLDPEYTWDEIRAVLAYAAFHEKVEE